MTGIRIHAAGVLFASAFLAVAAAQAQEPTVEMCLEHLKANPDAVGVYDQLGILYARRNDLTNAERYFRKAVKVDRLYSRGYFNLGVLKLNTGDYNAAMENFITAVTFATDDVQSLINLGNIYNIRNDLNNAFYYYQKAFSLNMNDPDLQNNLGVLALKHKNYPEAVGFLSHAWQASKDEDIQLNLATAYYYSGDKAKLRELYPVVSPQQKHYSTIIQLLGQ
jgi:tetratricopeptide (TPR) repeat protein